MARYTGSSVITSERAYQILRYIALEGEAYAKQISESIDADRSLVSEILQKLKEQDLVKEGKRTRAQYYEPNIEGFPYLFDELVEEKVLEGSSIEREEVKSILDSKKEMYESFDDYSIDEALERDFLVFYQIYIRHYLTSISNSTIQKMAFEDFLDGVLMHDTTPSDEPPGWFYYIRAIAKQYKGFSENPATIVGAALIDYEERPDTIEKQHTYYVVPGGLPVDESGFYDLEKKGENHLCKKCDEEVEDFEVGEESPCGCGVVETEETLARLPEDLDDNFEDMIDLQYKMNELSEMIGEDLDKEFQSDSDAVLAVSDLVHKEDELGKKMMDLKRDMNNLPDELQTESKQEKQETDNQKG